MHQTTSLFLDTLRFTAAMTVLLHHLTGQTFNSSFSPVPWGREAVIAFFVISGFVIAYVLDSRERDLKIYVSARLGRLYSVILPALFITPLLDHFGRQAAPDLYREIVADHVVLRILINLANLQESWNLTTAPLSNGPFWSLAFEFWYYVVFGAYTLLSGYSRQIVILLACLAAGPRIIFTMPVWLLGVVAYRLDQKTHLHRSSACVLFAISGLGIALYMTTFGHSVLQSLNDAIFGGSHSRYWTLGGHTLFLGDLPKLPADILLGILFATAIVTVKPAMEGLHPPVWISSSIRYLAGSTFSLYLFHAPLLYFIAANMHLQKHSAYSVTLLGVLVFLTCFALSYPTERQVGRYRAFFLDLISTASRAYQSFRTRMK